MNRSDLIDDVAARSGLDAKEVSAVIDALESSMAATLASGSDIRIPGFLTAQRVSRPARTGRNPRTGESMEIPARFGVKISAGTKLKKAV